jgi:hypothetical protein
MKVEQEIIERVRTLAPQRQQEVLEFLNRIEERDEGKQPLHILRGLWKDLGVHITEEDLAQARREMWGDFPRSLAS